MVGPEARARVDTGLVSFPPHPLPDGPNRALGIADAYLIPSIVTRDIYNLPPLTNSASHDVTFSESNRDLTPKPSATAHFLGYYSQGYDFLIQLLRGDLRLTIYPPLPVLSLGPWGNRLVIPSGEGALLPTTSPPTGAGGPGRMSG